MEKQTLGNGHFIFVNIDCNKFITLFLIRASGRSIWFYRFGVWDDVTISSGLNDIRNELKHVRWQDGSSVSSLVLPQDVTCDVS